MIKKILRNNFLRLILKFLFSLFYNKNYLKGKWFDEGFIGFKWCLKGIFYQKILRFNSNIPWPVSPFIKISNPNNIILDPDDLNNFQSFEIYFQNFSGKIYIGKGTYIGPNVGIITANHDINDLDKHVPAKDVIIGEKCWIGMNSVILPGVTLGKHTIVGAGSVVTKSFPDGNCVIAGNPAKIIKRISEARNE
jgi:acetyltransferase-like isoleucine patch superfamily enzyme